MSKFTVFISLVELLAISKAVAVTVYVPSAMFCITDDSKLTVNSLSEFTSSVYEATSSPFESVIITVTVFPTGISVVVPVISISKLDSLSLIYPSEIASNLRSTVPVDKSTTTSCGIDSALFPATSLTLASTVYNVPSLKLPTSALGTFTVNSPAVTVPVYVPTATPFA